ncbi:MAG TPA: replication initiator protein A, partial [Gemmatimonadaceae bacterium]|nr:replication initiator protein A [Gemmatimonadaceae bacterium]
MILAPRRRAATRLVTLDRALELLPIFRLSDSADEGAITYSTESGGRWRVLPSPGARLPGTFDQDVFVELLHRYQEMGSPGDGTITFTLHAFLRAMGRRVDGRTYEQLRAALVRLERTTLESHGAYQGPDGVERDLRFSLLGSVVIDRRRLADRVQLSLFPEMVSGEPGDARATLSPVVRESLAAGHASDAPHAISLPTYLTLGSPVARRLYRLLAAAIPPHAERWAIPLDRLAEQLPLTQRYPSHLQRVLAPAHQQLLDA